MRVFVVVLGVLYALAYTVPTVFVLNGAYGSIGFVKAGATGVLPAGADVNTVGSVAPGSPAQRAGIVAGDAVVKTAAEHAPAFEQLFDRAVAGRAADYTVTHGGRRRVVSLTPRATRPPAADAALIVVQLVRGLLIVAIGALLVLLRPSVMTAAFYALCLQFGELAHPANNLELLAAAPLFWKPVFLVLTGIVSGSGPAAAAFIVRYARASGEDRARLRWVAIGLGSFVVSYALFWASENVANAPARLATYAQFVNVLPLAVSYAIIRHRVIDVRVAGGRAIAFAALSAIPVIAFSLIDWALSNRLQQSRVAVVSEMCVGIGFGFWVNSLQRRIDGLIESVFFHARRVAEGRLNAAARRIRHASERAAVDEMLAREPYEALGLTVVALFRRVERAYVRVAQRGWPGDALAFIGENDPLVLELLATGQPVRVDTIAGAESGASEVLGHGLAFPVLARHDTIGVLLLGERADGERFDRLEREAVEALVEAAAITYEHLDAVESGRVADELRHALDGTRRENAVLRERLARGVSEV
jgi:hypothetical protein